MELSALKEKLAAAFPSVECPVSEFLGQVTVEAPAESVKNVLQFLKSEAGMDMLLDVTAVDYPPRAPRFDIIYILVSSSSTARLRVKTPIDDGQSVPTVSDLWQSANWGERECFDMFGIRFEGHPNLKRILNPDNFYGYPLRKTYPVRGERDPAFLDYKETEPA